MNTEQKIAEINAGTRLQCLIDGCDRTRKNYRAPGDYQWICQKHWTAVPKRLRRLYAKARRRYLDGRLPYSRVYRIWNKCVDAAIENAGMI